MNIQSYSMLSNKKYILDFNSNFSWNFLSSIKTEEFLEEFSKIFEIVPYSNSNYDSLKNKYSIVFCDLSELDKFKQLLDEGYYSYKQGSAYKILEDNKNNFFVVGVNIELFNVEEIKYISMSATNKLIYKSAIIHNKAIPIHAASLRHKNSGLIIIAPGGTGKSTIYNKVKNRKCWENLADDNALIFNDNEILIHPMATWSDYLMKREKTTFKVADGTILKKIYFLEQSTTDKIESIIQTKAIKKIVAASHETYTGLMSKLDSDTKRLLRINTLNFTMNILKKVNCSVLKATLSDNPIKLLENDLV